MAIVDRAFNYWFDRFVLDAGINRTGAAQTIAKAAFAAGRRAQAAEPTEARLVAVAPAGMVLVPPKEPTFDEVQAWCLANWKQHLPDHEAYAAYREAHTRRISAASLLAAFPLLDEAGLSETEHCCEWTLAQDRKRLHAMLAAPTQPATAGKE